MNDRTGTSATTHDCPAWCSREHLASTHTEDQVHRGPTIPVPATRRQALLPEFAPETVEYLVLPALAEGDREPWIVIAESEGPGKVALDHSTATRIVDALQRVLAQLDDV